MVEEYDYLFKAIIVGDGGVGKTALTIRFSKDYFTEDYKMTIGVDFHVKTIAVETDQGLIRTKLQIWDTGGQERFSSIRPMYYKGALGAIIVFDLTSYESFEHLPQWIEEIKANIKGEVPILLVGNKSDLISKRAVSVENVNSFTQRFNLYYMEASAKTGERVGDCFYALGCLMLGAGIPNKLIADGIVSTPGNVLIIVPKVEPEIERKIEFEAPSVPEPIPEKIVKLMPDFEPEPEIKFIAPPVPERPIEKISESKTLFQSESNIEFEAPPVPEPSPKNFLEPVPKFEPEIPVPSPKEDFLVEKQSKPIVSPLPIPSESPVVELYKPKTIPFSSNIPIPAPPPEEFRPKKEIKPAESISETTSAFVFTRKPEPPLTKPSKMLFNVPSEPAPALTELQTKPQVPFSQTSEQESESLIDYTSEALISKKERKKLEKQKKKEEKEKSKLEKEKKEKESKEKAILEKGTKEKEEKEKRKKKVKELESPPVPFQPVLKPAKQPEKPSLFQALTQKSEEAVQTKTPFFTPFTAATEPELEKASKIRIIPNISDIENKPRAVSVVPSTPAIKQQAQEQKKREIIICKQCGAILSSDYMFCNKCGSKL